MLKALSIFDAIPSGDRKLLIISVFGMALLLIWFFLGTSRVWPTDPIGTMTTTGPVKRRQSRSLEWGTIKKGGTIYLRDTVFIPPNTRSTVTFFNQTVLRLEPNTMVQFDEVNLSRMNVVLLKGNVVLVKNKPKKPKEETKSLEPYKLPKSSYSLNIPSNNYQSKVSKKMIIKRAPTYKPLQRKRTFLKPLLKYLPKKLVQTKPQDISSKLIQTKPTTKAPAKIALNKKPIAKPITRIQPQLQLKTPTVAPRMLVQKPAPRPQISRPVQISVRSQAVKPRPLTLKAPTVFKRRVASIKKFLKKRSVKSVQSVIPTTLSLIEPLEGIEGFLNTFRQLELKSNRFKNRPINFNAVRPMDMDPKQFELTQVVEFLINPAYPIPNSLVERENQCIPIVWTPVPLDGVSYYLEISRDNLFRYVRSYGTETNEVALLLDDGAEEYFWRVRAVLASESLVSTLTSFRLKRDASMKKLDQKEKSYLPEWEVCNIE